MRATDNVVYLLECHLSLLSTSYYQLRLDRELAVRTIFRISLGKVFATHKNCSSDWIIFKYINTGNKVLAPK